ncbi:MAG: hypothetical protein U0637_07650 [Phycisphaerales bacterium]
MTSRRAAQAGPGRSWGAGCAAAVLLLLTPVCAGQAGAPDARDVLQDNKRCMQCHGQEHIRTLSPQERLSMVGTWLDAEHPAPAGGGAAPAAEAAPGAPATREGLYILPDALAKSPHAANRCTDCHQDAAQLPHAARLQKATCATQCHARAAESYASSSHRAALDRGDPLAPTCASCHGGHQILKVSDRRSAQYGLNSLYLCGDCHKKHSATDSDKDPSGRISNYMDSAHARAVTKAGLPMAATCADCHTAHGVRPSKDPASSVNRANIPETCGRCHVGVAETYATSVHGAKREESKGKTAVCTDCHTAHQITLASTPHFMQDVISECGRCHDSPDAKGDRVGTYYQTYHESYHGQVTRLGGQRAARCSDCHGAHDILPVKDAKSRVAPANVVGTCRKCHPSANENFAKFNPHANFKDARNFPVLYGVWLYFMIVMTTVFTFFGLHTVLWFVRSLIERRKHGAHPAHGHASTAIRRFDTLDKINHAFVALTFFGLTATGIPLVFSDDKWARTAASLMGGIEAAGLWHRMFAVLLIANLVLHFLGLGYRFLNRGCSWKEWLFGPGSLLPRWKDVTDCLGMLGWFVRGRKRPRLDRWTYWEKFDYWAEVGGSFIIGGSGLLLWFPEIASRMLPGWAFNVAMIVHGYEALLAIGFIFTIHFFNAHLRPGTFPVDEVIFTGSMPEKELMEQRPEEYHRLVATGRLEALRVPAPDPKRRPAILVVAVVSVGFGLLLLAFILIGGFL